jgi:hypothetical protein
LLKQAAGTWAIHETRKQEVPKSSYTIRIGDAGTRIIGAFKKVPDIEH